MWGNTLTTYPFQVQTWIFLAGASAGTSTTVAFLYVLARFPGFIQHVKDGGAEPDVVVRLATFYSLNVRYSKITLLLRSTYEATYIAYPCSISIPFHASNPYYCYRRPPWPLPYC